MLIIHKHAQDFICPQSITAGTVHGCFGVRCAAFRVKTIPQRRHEFPFTQEADRYSETEPQPRPANIPADWEFVPSEDGESAHYREPVRDAIPDARGYCGLAGDLTVPFVLPISKE